MPINTITDWVEQIIPYGSLWAIGWIAMYLNQVRKGKPFRIGTFIINVLVAGWIGIVVKDFIPESAWDLTYSIVSMTWFMAFPILDYMEDKWMSILIKRILWKKQ